MTVRRYQYPGVLREIESMVGATDLDFRMTGGFVTARETADWARAWTGNSEAVSDDFLFFADDWSGAQVGFWLLQPAVPLEQQPVLIFSSESDYSVIARDLGDFLVLLAHGIAPHAAMDGWSEEESLDKWIEANVR